MVRGISLPGLGSEGVGLRSLSGYVRVSEFRVLGS